MEVENIMSTDNSKRKTIEYNNTEWSCRIHNDLSYFVAVEDQNFKYPANGGLRFTNYLTEQKAFEDSITLSKLMGQKHSIYNTGFSGAKIVAKGEPSEKNKFLLLDSVSSFLNSHKGNIYTGCDLNTNSDDMKYLFASTPYVLSAIGTEINPSHATSYGIMGSIKGAFNSEIKGRSFLVHGTGKTGSLVCKMLLSSGCTVYTYDKMSHAFSVKGCVSLGPNNWADLPVDGLVLCSASKVLTNEFAKKLKCQWIISGANDPFENIDVIQTLSRKGIKWIPDPITNAGAVICDSIEFYNKKEFTSATPDQIYNFVEKKIFDKVCLYKTLEKNLENVDIRLKLLEKIGGHELLKCGETFSADK